MALKIDRPQIGKFLSEVLCLGFPDFSGNVVLLNVDRPALQGGRMKTSVMVPAQREKANVPV